MRMICQLPDVCNVREDHAKSKKTRVIRPYAQCSCRVNFSCNLLSYCHMTSKYDFCCHESFVSTFVYLDGCHLGTSLMVSG